MNTRSISTAYHLSRWAQLMQERAQRGLTVRPYRAETGIYEKTYFHWQRKLRADNRYAGWELQNPMG